MKIETKIIPIGGSYGLVLPKLIREHLEVGDGTNIIIMDDEGKHGKFIAIWKKNMEENK